MKSNVAKRHVVVINRWSVGWSGGHPPYEAVLDHDAFCVSYIVDEEGLKGLSASIKARCAIACVGDIKDLEALATALQSLVDRLGVVDRLVALSEWDLLNASALRARFDISGMQPESALAVRDKVTMKQKVLAAGIKAPQFAPCHSANDLRAFAAQYGFPIVLKPRKMAASIGVHIIASAADLESVLVATPTYDDLEVETYCPGTVFHVDGLMSRDQLVYAVPFRYTRPPVEFFQGQPLGAISLPEGPLCQRLIAFSERVARALHICNTHFHLELIIDESLPEQEPTFLEIGARVGGADIPRAVELITGVDAVKQQLRLEMGLEALPFRPVVSAHVAAYYLVPFPSNLPRVVTFNGKLTQLAFPTLVDQHRREVGEILDGTGGYLKIPARFVFAGTPAQVLQDMARVEVAHHYHHGPLPATGTPPIPGLLALVHCGLSFCEEIAATARAVNLPLFVISSRYKDRAPLAKIAPELAFVHMTEADSLDESNVEAALGVLHASGFQPLACIATMESYRIMAATLNASFNAPDALPAALRLAMDKQRCRETLYGAGLSRVQAQELTPELLERVKEDGHAYFIKPRRGAASFGAFKLSPDTDFAQIAQLIAQITQDQFVTSVFYGDHGFILENFVPGPEYSFELVVMDGKVHIALTHAKVHSHTAHSVLEDQLVSPGVTCPEALDRAKVYLDRIFHCLSLRWGLYHVEMRHAPWGWELIEINTRIGGGLINESARRKLKGASLIELWVYNLLGTQGVPQITQKVDAALTHFESTACNSHAAVRTLQQYVYGEPGRQIDSVCMREGIPAPLLNVITMQPGDRIPDSEREHDLAMGLWASEAETHDEAQWQKLLTQAKDYWKVTYMATQSSCQVSPVLRQIRELLTSAAIAFKEVSHEHTLTSQASAQARGESLRVGGKALLIKADQRFVIAVISAARQVNNKKLRSALGAQKIRFATTEELHALTGVAKGALPPFGTPLFDLALVADRSVLAQEEIAFNAGSLTDSIIMATRDWQRLANPQWVDFAA